MWLISPNPMIVQYTAGSLGLVAHQQWPRAIERSILQNDSGPTGRMQCSSWLQGFAWLHLLDRRRELDLQLKNTILGRGFGTEKGVIHRIGHPNTKATEITSDWEKTT